MTTQKRFNIAHIVPRPSMHGLRGYQEVIDTMRWGLENMGHDVSVTTNAVEPDRINILFGAQVLPEQTLLQELPRNTIVYNLEQMAGLDLSANPVARAIAGNFRIWDYSASNIPSWGLLQPAYPVVHVPVGWAPVLKRIQPSECQEDIDVLFYGKPSQLRLQVFYELCLKGLTCVFVSGMYGEARDQLISRAKVVLNINLYDHSRIFEIVRVSYLLANGKAVVADRQPDTFIEPGLEGAVAFSDPARIADTCQSLVEDENARRQLETRGKEAIEKRLITPILTAACAESGLL